MLERTASSEAMFRALVTTRNPGRTARARATSVDVVPPFRPTEVVSGDSSVAVIAAIARFASWC